MHYKVKSILWAHHRAWCIIPIEGHNYGMYSNQYVRVGLPQILSFVNGKRVPGCSPASLQPLWWVKKQVCQRYGHLKGKRVEDFPPGSYCLVPFYWIDPKFSDEVTRYQ